MGWGWLCYAKTGRFVATFSTVSRFLLPFRAESGTAAKFSFCNGPIYRVYEAKIPVFPVISTKNDSRITDQIVREYFFTRNSSRILGTFWCRYPSLDTVWCNTDMINAEFVYQTNPAFITFMRPKSLFFL